MGNPATANTNANIAELNQNNLSAYFASLITPVINPQAITAGSGTTYTGSISPDLVQDYLVNSTTYGITAGAGRVVNAAGNYSGTAPAVTVATLYNITLSATNGALTGTANLALTVNPAAQAITFGAAPAITVGGTGVLSATGDSVSVVILSSNSSSICSVAGNTITGLSAGTCSITANQAAGLNAGNTIGYSAATATTTFVIAKGTPTLLLTPPTLTVNGSGSISASSASTGAITFSSATPSICTVGTGNPTSITVTLAANAGNLCSINANQVADANYNAAAQATSNITLSVANQAITYGAVPTLVVAGSGTISATASSGLAVSLSSNTPAVCTLPAASISPALITVAAGAAQGSICQISASQAGNGNYAAATTLTQNITLGQGTQTLGFATAPTLVVGGTGSVSATSSAASAGLTSVTYSTASASCSVTLAGVVTGISASPVKTPDCLITATQAGNASFAAATATQTVGIGQGSQVLKLGRPILTVGGAAGTISVISFNAVSGAATGLLSTLSIPATPSVCSITGSPAAGYSITPLSAGTCTVVATQAGDANYSAAPANTASFTIGVGTQSITAVIPPTISVNTSGTISATKGASTSPVIFSSLTPAICTATGVNGATITGISAGTCVIAADQAADANYAIATQVQTKFAVGLGTQTITFGAAPTLSVGGTGTLQATASSGLPVSFSSTTPVICSVTGNSVTALSAGSCVVAANQAGDANYTAAAQITQTIALTHLAPVANATTMTVPLNTATTLDLTASINATSLTGVTLASGPAHGTLTVNGTKVTYTPAHNYFGADGFTYAAIGLGGTSAAATVTISIVGRPDPSLDAAVMGLLSAQADTALRFAGAQIANFQHRMESLHHRAQTAPASVMRFNDSMDATPTDAPAASYPLTSALTAPTASNTFSSNPAAASVPNENPAWAYGLVGLVTTQSLNLANLVGNSNATAGSNSAANIWVEGIATFGKQAANGTRTGSEFSSNGVSVGMDRRIGSDLTLGFGVGFARDKTNIGTDGSKNQTTGNSVSLYGSYQANDSAFVDGLLGIGTLNFDMQRFVAPANAYASSTRQGRQLFASVATGIEHRAKNLLVSPYARLDYSSDQLNQVTETGAGINNLTYFKQTNPTLQGALGVRLEAQHDTSFGSVSPRLRSEYRHNFQGNRVSSIAYADNLNSQYSVSSGALVRNSIVLGLGNNFMLDNGVSIDLDYQHQHTFSQTQNDSVRVNLTKALDAPTTRRHFSEADDEAAEHSGVQVDAGLMFDDNITRATQAGDILSDHSYSFNANKNWLFPVGNNMRAILTGTLGGEKFANYDGLSHVLAGGKASYQYRPSSAFGSPILGVFASGNALQYRSQLRDGYSYSTGVDMRFALTDRINAYTALAANGRTGKSAVFNSRDTALRGNLDYAVTAQSTLYLGGEYRSGDIVSTGHPSLMSINIAKVLVPDDAYAGGQLFSYRIDGKTIISNVGYNIGLGSRDSFDISWRRATATPTLNPRATAMARTYTPTQYDYVTNQYSVVYLISF
ncbi:MAG: autotransporter domain-containing protein [Gallionella sp.]